MKTFELQPIDGRKSFYNKAKVTELDNGDIELTSYTTIVARIHNGKFERLWNGYSATTMRHINAFLYVYGIQGGGKVWWENLETVKNSARIRRTYHFYTHYRRLRKQNY